MRTNSIMLTILVFILNISLSYSQEWANLRVYQKESGNHSLQDGCWLKKDRKRQSRVWTQANLYNLTQENGNLKYKTISQIRDFYLWFDNQRKKQGHEIKWIGIAEIAAGQLSKLDCSLVRFFIIRNNEVVRFANEGSSSVFKFAFPLLKEIYFSSETLKGKDAEKWFLEYGKNEQCQILEPIYKKLSTKALHKLDRMAKGKGLYAFGIQKELRYVGNIKDCQLRFEHGVNRILPYYLKNNPHDKEVASNVKDIESNLIDE